MTIGRTIDKGPFIEIPADIFYQKGYDTKPHDTYKTPNEFPNCCDSHRNIKKELDDWFLKFPNCCEQHKEVSKRSWFKKSLYNELPLKVIIKAEYCLHFFEVNINEPDWYTLITDYIDYTFQSFGIPNVGANRLYSILKRSIFNEANGYFSLENEWKKTILLEFFDSYVVTDSDIDKGKYSLNLLHSTFQKWLKSIPDIYFLKEFKSKYQGKFPLNLVLYDGRFNQFSGTTKYKSRTNGELIEILTKQTKELLAHLSNQKQSNINSISAQKHYEILLISESHELKQKKLLIEYSKKEIKYISILKKWLKNEREFLRELKEISSSEYIQDELILESFTDLEKFYEQLINRIYYFGCNLEKNPRFHRTYEEEDYRDYFLPHLNQISKKLCATGETFNRKGKTDILIQDNNGVNIFIGECKLWKGERFFLQAIDQLFLRYVGWRDEKVSIIIFSKTNKDFSNVIDTVKSSIKNHILYFQEIGQRHQSVFSYKFRNNEDRVKIISLDIILFNCYVQ